MRPTYQNSTLAMSEYTSVIRIEAQALRWQQFAFCVLTAGVMAALLLLHVYFANLLGEPTAAVVEILAGAFLVKLAEGAWLLRQREGISEFAARVDSIITIPGVFILTAVLAILTDRDDAPYFVLLSIPILQCAYRFGLIATVSTIVGSIAMIFVWAQHFFALHPPARPTEFLEAGMISVIYSLMGLLVWYLVRQLNLKQAKLYQNMSELEATREKLAAEEKLAAVGRLASGIAHEIRNPVAMISSSLATASADGFEASVREEMFSIAAREAKRLESLTIDFLNYARPSPPQRSKFDLADILRHVANVTRMRGLGNSISVRCEASEGQIIDVDASQIESALVNLSMNAIDATPSGGTILLNCWNETGKVHVEVENSGPAIPDEALAHIFEPFFTTKAHGTGLGLAISRAVARAHGGDLVVSKNRVGSVAFRMTLLSPATLPECQEVVFGESTRR